MTPQKLFAKQVMTAQLDGFADFAHPRPDNEALVDPVLEKLVTDTQSAALLCATITSVANVLREPGVPRTKAELQVYLPSSGGMSLSLALLSRESGLSIESHASISDFFASIEPGLAATDRFFSDTEIMGESLAAAMHQFALVKAWRPVCKLAARAMGELSTEVGDRLPDLYGLSTGVLVRLLTAVARGESPCVDAAGKPFLPPLPQRRRTDRRMLGQSALIVSEGRLIRGFVRDVSQGGLGLDHISKLKEGMTATIELETGRRFTGTISWCKGSRAGVRFTLPLTPNDPLLWG